MYLIIQLQGVPIVPQRVSNQTCIHKDDSSIPGLNKWVKDPAFPGAVVQVTDRVRCRVAVAVVQADSCSSDLTPRLGISICHRCGPKKQIIIMIIIISSKYLMILIFFIDDQILKVSHRFIIQKYFLGEVFVKVFAPF